VLILFPLFLPQYQKINQAEIFVIPSKLEQINYLNIMNGILIVTDNINLYTCDFEKCNF